MNQPATPDPDYDESISAYRLSPQQHRAGPDAVTTAAILATGDVDRARLAAAVDALQGRHEILRTRFVSRGVSATVQVIDTGPHRAPATVHNAAGGYRLQWSVPARVLDEESLVILTRELARSYAGDAIGADPLQYADYVGWLEETGTLPVPRPSRYRRTGVTAPQPLPPGDPGAILQVWQDLVGSKPGELAEQSSGRAHAELVGAVGPYASWTSEDATAPGWAPNPTTTVRAGGVQWQLEWARCEHGPALVLRIGHDAAWIEYDPSVHSPQTADRLLTAVTQHRPGARSNRRGPDIVSRANTPAHPLTLVDGDRRWTAATLEHRVNAVAAAVRAYTSGCPEAPVVLAAALGAEAVAALLGLWRAGAAAILVDGTGPAARLTSQLELTTPALVLTDQPTGLAGVDVPRLDIGRGAAIWSEPPGPPPPAQRPLAGQLAYTIFTSGTGGTPKAVDVPHAAVTAYTESLIARLGASAGQAWAMVTPLHADLGFTALFPAFWTGGELIVHRDMEADLAAADYAKITPRHLAALLEAASDPAAILPRRALLIGGEQWDLALYERLREVRPDLTVWNHYGPSETTVGVLTHRLNDSSHGRHPALGTPLSHARVAVTTATGADIPDGQAGELLVSGPSLARGYRANPWLTAERFRPDPAGDGGRRYRTGDRVHRNPDGTYQHIGRTDAQLSVAGFRVEPTEIEGALRSHPAVAAAAVTTIEGASLQGIIVPADSTNTVPALQELRAWLAQRLPLPLIPTQLTWTPALPLTPVGKLDRRAVTAMVATSAGQAWSAPADDVEARLARIWCDVLGRPAVGALDNFFALGGDSIKGLQTASRARAAGLRFTPRDLFERPTIRELAAITLPCAEHPHDPEQAPCGEVPLTPAAAEFFGRNGPDPHHYNQAFWLITPGELDPDLLQRALSCLTERHDALRTSFTPGLHGWHANTSARAREVPFGTVDLSALPPAHADAEAARLATELQGRLQLRHAPLMAARLLKMPHGNRLLWIAHHLVVDGVSWQVLFEQVQRAYLQLAAGAPIDLGPASVPHGVWAGALTQRFPPPGAGGASPTLAGTAGDTTTTRAELDEPTTSTLLAAAAAHNTTPLVAFIAAAVAALAELDGGPAVRIEVESHGRNLVDGMDAARTVGWLTTRLPIEIRAVTTGFADLITTVAHALQTAQPLADTSAVPAPVGLNFFGHVTHDFPPGSVFSEFGEIRTGVRAPSTPRRHELEINAEIACGRLLIDWTHDRGPERTATVARLAEALAGNAGALAATLPADEPPLSPADFPAAALTGDDLDQILAHWYAEEFE